MNCNPFLKRAKAYLEEVENHEKHFDRKISSIQASFILLKCIFQFHQTSIEQKQKKSNIFQKSAFCIDVSFYSQADKKQKSFVF